MEVDEKTLQRLIKAIEALNSRFELNEKVMAEINKELEETLAKIEAFDSKVEKLLKAMAAKGN